MIIYLKNVKKKDLDISLKRKLDNLEFYFKGNITITSGLRTIKHNKEVGGVANSSHLKGLACDLRYKNSKEAFLIVKTALDAGFKRIGISKSHIHLDVDKQKLQYCLWLE